MNTLLRSLFVALTLVSVSAPLGGPGVALGWDCCGLGDVGALGASWWVNYRADTLLDGPGHVFLVGSEKSPAYLTDLARTHPGRSWILGNEPNVAGQDNCGGPGPCGDLWRSQAMAIRYGDPGAYLVGAGLGECDVAWAADLVRGHGDTFAAWNCHLYSRESSASYTLSKVDAFRSWLASRGDTRPLILGEVGIAPDEPDSLAAPVLRTLANSLPAHGVTTWAWFSLRSAGHWRGDLEAADGSLTGVGRAYRRLVTEPSESRPAWWRGLGRVRPLP